MNSFDRSAIIGHYLNGATVEQIAMVTVFEYWQINEVIDDYKKTRAEDNSEPANEAGP